jgi:hypothetical protein
MPNKAHTKWKRHRLTPEAAAKGNAFVQQLLIDNVPLEVAKAALAQLMVLQGLALNGGQKKATGRKLYLTREWVREIHEQTKRKSERLIPFEPVEGSPAPAIAAAAAAGVTAKNFGMNVELIPA